MKSLIDRMVDRFLGWPLPETFGPDCGISFKAMPHPNGWPTGTNLFTATEARQMFEHALDGAAPELSLRELDSIGQGYFNGPLNSNEEMFGRAVERAVRGRLLGSASVAPTRGAPMAADLKYCPHCGSEPGPLLLARVNASEAVVCNCCGARGPLDDTEAEAIAAWNRRRAPDGVMGTLNDQGEKR